MSLREPENEFEGKVVQELDTPIGFLSKMVNGYSAGEFKGKLANSIPLEDSRELETIFLDDDDIVMLVSEGKNINLKFYSRLSGDLMTTSTICSFEEELYVSESNMVITPKRNILIYFNVKGLLGGHIYYCNQKGEVLWRKNRKAISDITALNDDAVLLNDPDVLTLINGEDEKTLNFSGKKSPGDFLYDSNYDIVPCGKKGFIYYSSNRVYLYDDNLTERKLFQTNDIDETNTRIKTIEVIDADTIVYGTTNSEMVFYNIKEEKRISCLSLGQDGFKVREIKILPNKKYLVIISEHLHLEQDNSVIILDPSLGQDCVQKIYNFGEFVNYLGITSGGDVMISGQIDEKEGTIVIVHNLSKNDSIEHKIGNKIVSCLSSFDSIIVRQNLVKPLAVEIWE